MREIETRTRSRRLHRRLGIQFPLVGHRPAYKDERSEEVEMTKANDDDDDDDGGDDDDKDDDEDKEDEEDEGDEDEAL